MNLSIVIAAYNVENYIEKCILSCIQDSGAFEYDIIVVDDGSNDQTPEILTKLQNEHSIVKVVTQKNSGLGAARNTGLQHSNADYVWFIDGDDALHEDVVLKIITETLNKKLDTLILNYAAVNEQFEILQNHGNRPENVSGIFSGGDYYEHNYSKSYTWLFVFKRKLFTENAIYFKERINMQDSEILPKLMFHANRISFFDEVCYYYMQQPGSFTNSKNAEKRYKYFESIIAVRDSLEGFLASDGYKNSQIASGIRMKLQSLHHIVYNHLVFTRYEEKWLEKIIVLLRNNRFFPLQYGQSAKTKLVAMALNAAPVFTKKIIDGMRNS